MDKDKYLQKIKKLLNLAKKSSNANEAANAMRQAQNLMKEHSLTATDVDLMEIRQANSAGAPSNAEAIPKYMGNLAAVICWAFGVKCFHDYKSVFPPKRMVVFYGPNERPQIAAYAFDVLMRQMMKARKEYRSSMRKSIKASTKTARADTFCENWVLGAYQAVDDFAVTQKEKALMEICRRKLMDDTGLKTGELREAKPCRGSDDAAEAGYRAGLNAKLHHGVNGAGTPQPLRIGGVK